MKYKVIIIAVTFLNYLNSIAQNTKNYKVYFEVDEYVIMDTEKANFISFIEENKSRIKHISFTGYCDDKANSDYNLLLSKKRAVMVKDLAYTILNKRIPHSLKYKGELGLKKVKNIEQQRKQNRRVEITCVLSAGVKTNSNSDESLAKQSTEMPKQKGVNYHDFLDYVADSEPGVKRERMKFANKQKHLDSISKIVTEEEIKDFEQEFFKTKKGHSLPTELEYQIKRKRNRYNKYDVIVLLKLKSRKKLKLLSVLMHKYPELKVKFYAYTHKVMKFKRTRNKAVERDSRNKNSKKIFLAIKYLTNEGIAKDRISYEFEMVKKVKLNASRIDRWPEVAEIIRLN